LPLTVEDVQACHVAILGYELKHQETLESFSSTYSDIGELISHFLAQNGFLSQNFFGKAPFLLPPQAKYLFKNIGEKQHFDYYFYHHNYLCENISTLGYLNLIKEGIILYQICPADVLYQILVHKTGFFSYEGELSLSLIADGDRIFSISFNIVPGKMFGSPDRTAILISRIQGWPGKFDLIRKATREISDVAPQHLLYSALRGIAKCLGIDAIMGVCGANHSSHVPEKDELFTKIYDDFFESISATRTADGFFETRISDRSAAEKTVKAGHRIRTRRKRKLKAEIERSVEMLSRLMFSSDEPASVHNPNGHQVI